MEDNAYDPHQAAIIDDEDDKAYEPAYVSPQSNNVSPYDDDDEVPLPSSTKPEAAAALKSAFESKSPYLSSDEDREYRVEPAPSDVYTPGYAPSHPLDSDHSGDDMSPSYSDVDFNLSPSIPSKTPRVADSPSPDTAAEAPALKDSPSTSPKREVPFNLFDDDEDLGDDSRQGGVNEDFEGFERDDEPESQVNGIIADIFGESDAEEEFEGFAENEVDKGAADEGDVADQATNVVRETSQSVDEAAVKSGKGDSSGSDSENEGVGDAFVSDFDALMARRKDEMRRKRRRNHDIEFLNDADDKIIALISRMKTAANEDRQLLKVGHPATKKLSMVKEVVSYLRRCDLKTAIVENGMMGAITEWLTPLPGYTLPNLMIRDELLKCLMEFQSVGTEVLQESGVGKALMYLTKHPRETRENKERATRLINIWLRPIFNLTSDYRTMSRDERKELDNERLPKRRHIDNETLDRRDINREMDSGSKVALRPGDPGWINRARVPQPSTKDYIVRPKWNQGDNSSSSSKSAKRSKPRREEGDQSDGDDGDQQEMFEEAAEEEEYEEDDVRPPPPSRKSSKKKQSSDSMAIERLKSVMSNLTKQSRRSQTVKVQRAATMSIGGNKMAL